MLELPHTLIGAAIAINIPNPIISIPLAFASHFLVDFIPHWNPSLHTETKKHGRPQKKSIQIIVIDASLSLIAGTAIAAQFWPDYTRMAGILLACFAAVLPDVIEAPYFFLNFRPKIINKIIKWQHDHQGRAEKIPGLLIQAVAAAIAILLIFL